jgi:hypothetical protein
VDATAQSEEHWFSASLKAMVLMEEALSILDELAGFGESAAHLDLALCRLREKVDPGGAAHANAVALRSLDSVVSLYSAERS